MDFTEVRYNDQTWRRIRTTSAGRLGAGVKSLGRNNENDTDYYPDEKAF